MNPQQLLNEAWLQRLESICEFVALNGRMPRYKHHSSEYERTLGVWLHNQHQKRARGNLSSSRHKALDAALPGWKSRQ
ncbi:helicase associated domain-containing protein [Arthrobacter sp. LS16]|uniref:helicase associated domain-containing protein n=1 Tax=Arthrobacter sp. 'calajunan' TaxID=1690248 RepID=UPI003C708091